MKILTKSRYGLRMMIQLGINWGKGATQLSEIAEIEDISVKYLEQIIPPLKKIGIISSRRGSSGGYLLTRPPEEILLKDIILPLEGGEDVVDCLRDESICDKSSTCPTRKIWKGFSNMIVNYFSATSLGDLLDVSKEKDNKKEEKFIEMYYI